MTELTPGVVTAGDLYRVLVDLNKNVSTALERLAVIESRNQLSDQVHADHEARIRHAEAGKAEKASVARLGERIGRLEGFRARLTGIALAAGLVEGVVGYWIGHILH